MVVNRKTAIARSEVWSRSAARHSITSSARSRIDTARPSRLRGGATKSVYLVNSGKMQETNERADLGRESELILCEPARAAGGRARFLIGGPAARLPLCAATNEVHNGTDLP
jgi:hypothetical protein